MNGFTFNFSHLDPLELFGEGQYNLNNIKEISVTDSFMGLDRASRKCQNIETYTDCKTRLYVEHLRKECGCLPLFLKLTEKVEYKSNIFFIDVNLPTGCSVHDKRRNYV